MCTSPNQSPSVLHIERTNIKNLLEIDQENNGSFTSNNLEEQLNTFIVGQKKVSLNLFQQLILASLDGRTKKDQEVCSLAYRSWERQKLLSNLPSLWMETLFEVSTATRYKLPAIKKHPSSGNYWVWPPGFGGTWRRWISKSSRENPMSFCLTSLKKPIRPLESYFFKSLIQVCKQTTMAMNLISENPLLSSPQILGVTMKESLLLWGLEVPKHAKRRRFHKVDETKLRAELKMMGYGP